MSAQINLVAVMSAAPGKIERLIEVLSTAAEEVKANEPGILKYELFREVGKDDIVVLESYKDEAALGAHRTATSVANMGKAFKEEGLLAAPPSIKITSPAIAGFASR